MSKEQAQAQGRIEVGRIYIRDVSFESPNATEGTGKEWKPEVTVNINFSSSKLDAGAYEVSLRCTVTCRNSKKTAYVIEVDQAGIFAISGLAKQQIQAILGTYCANMLFPYVREAVDNLLVKGGFPAITLAPINFEQLYAESQAAKQQEDAPPEERVTH